jgi:hypothetical protein
MQSEPDPRKWLYQEQQELQKLQQRLAKRNSQHSRPIWIATAIAISLVVLIVVVMQFWDILVAFVSRWTHLP